MTTATKQPYRAVFLASLGSGLEYYCFICYALLSPTLSQLFFVKENPWLATLNTMIIFAIGYITAPLGAFLFGGLADRYGRKPLFIVSLALMALATFLIGCLPTFKTAGYLGVSLLVIFRLLQGIAGGAEIPGGITFIVEHAKDQHRAFLCGLMFFSVAMGAMLSTLVNFVLNHYLTSTQMLDYGWRLAFWIGGLLGVIGLFARKSVSETPLFLEEVQTKNRLFIWHEILNRPFIKSFLISFAIMLFPASLVTFGLFLPDYYQRYYHVVPATAYFAMTMGFFWSAFGLPIFGYLADARGHKRWYIGAALVGIILLPPCFMLLFLGSTMSVYVSSILYYFLIVAMAAVYPCLLAESFPTRIRYTGVGLSYMLCYSFVGFVPVLVNYLIFKTHQVWAGLYYFIPAALISLVAAYYLRDITGKALD